MAERRSIAFFETQFQRQVREGDFALNPFEKLALDHVRGEVLEFGCGLGNLALEAARRGCTVTAVDAAPSGIEHVRARAAAEELPVRAFVADFDAWQVDRNYDTIVAIGLLMFFPRKKALAMLEEIKARVVPGGVAVVNVLTEGTTFLGMFDAGHYCLFGADELRRAFAGWEVLVDRADAFPAPGDTLKVFSTVIARKSRA